MWLQNWSIDPAVWVVTAQHGGMMFEEVAVALLWLPRMMLMV